jgi:4-aminobutyrate aminotransferase/(S)-3-amino-2-methylpropionate transaminase
VYGNGIRIMVPLTVSDAVLDEGLGIIEKSLAEIAQATRLPREAAAAAR